MSQIVKFIYLIDRGVGFRDFAFLIILILPSLFFTILPFAMAIGTLVTYNRLSCEHELVTLSNSGLSPMDLAKPALIVATLVTIICYFISMYLLPLSYSTLKSNLTNLRSNYVSHLVQDRVFTQVAKNITLYVDDKTPTGSLKGIILFDNRNADRRAILFAKQGDIRFQPGGAPYFELKNGIKQEIDQLGKVNKMHFEILSVVLDQNKCSAKVIDRQKEGDVKNSECSNIIDPANKELQEHYLDELFTPAYPLSDLRRSKLKAEGHQRIIWPLHCLALTSLAVGLFMQKPYSRRGNGVILTKIGVIFMLVIGTHFAANNASSKKEIMNFLGYTNIVFCFALSYFLLTEKWINKKNNWLKYLT